MSEPFLVNLTDRTGFRSGCSSAAVQQQQCSRALQWTPPPAGMGQGGCPLQPSPACREQLGSSGCAPATSTAAICLHGDRTAPSASSPTPEGWRGSPKVVDAAPLPAPVFTKACPVFLRQWRVRILSTLWAHHTSESKISWRLSFQKGYLGKSEAQREAFKTADLNVHVAIARHERLRIQNTTTPTQKCINVFAKWKPHSPHILS